MLAESRTNNCGSRQEWSKFLQEQVGLIRTLEGVDGIDWISLREWAGLVRTRMKLVRTVCRSGWGWSGMSEEVGITQEYQAQGTCGTSRIGKHYLREQVELVSTI